MSKTILISLLLLINCKVNTDDSGLLGTLSVLFYRTNQITVTGSAVKGIAKNAQAVINPINSDGTCNTNVTLAKDFTTDSGDYTLTYPKTGSNVCLTISANPNGTTTVYDEKSGTYIPYSADSSFSIQSILPEDKAINNSRSNVKTTPFSSLITKRFQSLMKSTGSGANPRNIYKKAAKEMVIRFGLNSGLSSSGSKSIPISKAGLSDENFPEIDDIDIDFTKPDDPKTAKIIAIMSGISHMANQYKSGTTTSASDFQTVINAFAADFEDGKFDGKDINGNAITLGSGSNAVTLSSTSLSSNLLPAIVNYIKEGGKLTVGKPVKTKIPTISADTITASMAFNDATEIISNISLGSGTSVPVTTSGPTISYSTGTYAFGNGVPVSQIPIITNGPVTVSVSPALPTGLTLNTTTGEISGTPTVTGASTAYTISATNSGGTTTTVTLNIEILGAVGGAVYPSTTYLFTESTPITTVTPTLYNTPTSLSVAPTLPTGLSFNTSTGQITGTPSVSSVATNYTITATNATGSSTATISITINAAPPLVGAWAASTGISATQFTLNWTKATDAVTPQANLFYKLVKSSSSTAIDTLAEADAITGADLVMDWTQDVSTKTLTGLTEGTSYYFRVIVKDAEGAKALYSEKIEIPTFRNQFASVTTGNSGNDDYNGGCRTSTGNIVLAGGMTGNNALGFGNGITITPTNTLNVTYMVVAYNSSGVAQWGNTIYGTGQAGSQATSAACDDSGNAYVVGDVSASNPNVINFNTPNDAVQITGSGGQQAVFVKYNSTGIAQFAKVGVTSVGTTYMKVFKTSTNDYIILGRYWGGTGTIDFGNSVVLTLASPPSQGFHYWVKYNSSGVAQAAQLIKAQRIFDAAIDSGDNVYVMGTSSYNGANNTEDFGNGITLVDSDVYYDPYIVKFNSSLQAQLAVMPKTSTNGTTLHHNAVSMAVDPSGNMYISASINGSGTSPSMNFGNGITLTPDGSQTTSYIVKFNSSGIAQSVKPFLGVGPGLVRVDSSGKIYWTTVFTGTKTFDSVSITPAGANDMVMYILNSSMVVQKGFTQLIANNKQSQAREIIFGTSGDVYVAAKTYLIDSFNFGSGTVTGGGSNGWNLLFLKYQ